jgi:hypothetical protein
VSAGGGVTAALATLAAAEPAAPSGGGVTAAVTGVASAARPEGPASSPTAALLVALNAAVAVVDASARAAASAPVQQLKMRLTVGDTIHELLIPFRTGQAFKLDFSVVA